MPVSSTTSQAVLTYAKFYTGGPTFSALHGKFVTN